ncbi:hypothetical protein BC830DRAFT_1233398 [Chytriomyces sp. MP71]|nr:hypothetical protein BC830DRAFT_1233398 [Chytriomyces sp. MP71]
MYSSMAAGAAAGMQSQSDQSQRHRTNCATNRQLAKQAPARDSQTHTPPSALADDASDQAEPSAVDAHHDSRPSTPLGQHSPEFQQPYQTGKQEEVSYEIPETEPRGSVWSNASDAEEEVIETTLESCLKELIAATAGFSPWRARMFLRYKSGIVLPFHMLDIALLTSAYLSLSPSEHLRFSTLHLSAPLSVARILVFSKMLNFFFLSALFLSIVLLCVETDPLLNTTDLVTIFSLEVACMFAFLAEIVIQRLCIQHSFLQTLRAQYPHLAKRAHRLGTLLYTLTFSDKKALRITAGAEGIPRFKLLRPRIPPESARDNHSLNVQASEPEHTPFGNPRFEYIDSESTQWNWLVLDLVATLPFFVAVIIYAVQTHANGGGLVDMINHMYTWNGAPDFLRFLRILRILRLFKVGQKSDRGRIIWKAISNSLDGVGLLATLLPLFVIFSSFLFFYAEHTFGYLEQGTWHNADGTISSFQSILDAFWFILVTVTTIGYGDVFPHTFYGRFVACVVMFFSLFLIAFPLCLITMQYTHYARLFSDQKRAHLEAARQLRARIAAADESILFHPTAAPSFASGFALDHTFRGRGRMDILPVSIDTLFGGAFSRPGSRNSRVESPDLPDAGVSRGNSVTAAKPDASKSNALASLDTLKHETAVNAESLFLTSAGALPTVVQSPDEIQPLKMPTPINSTVDPLEVEAPNSHRNSYRGLSIRRTRTEPNFEALPRSSSSDDELLPDHMQNLFASPSRHRFSSTESMSRKVGSPRPKVKRSESLVSIKDLDMSKAKSQRGATIRDIERHVGMGLGDQTPRAVWIRVQDWRLDYKAERREDVLQLRLKVKDEEAFRKLMKVLAELGA